MSTSAERRTRRRRAFLAGAGAAGLTAGLVGLALDGSDTATGGDGDHAETGSVTLRWALEEFEPSTLTLRERLGELAFFARAAMPFRRMQVFVVSEDTPTHRYEARVLARAFREITGITVIHDVVQEGEVVDRLQQQRRTGRNLYDAYVNDTDFIGTHYRRGGVTVLSDWITGDGAEFTLPSLDLDDLIGIGLATAPDGNLYQLPDQQFANLYWFRHDWFERPAIRQAFEARTGYRLGVPVNWQAYEDIADFFTNVVREIDGQRVWGHMDHGAREPALGWRFTDAWLGLAGVGDPGGAPVNDWGLRVEDCVTRGASVSRGGATNAAAAVNALETYLHWLEAYAPPESRGMTFQEAGRAARDGAVAQQVSWYSAFTADLIGEGSAVQNPDGSARWRVAPAPRGPHWRPGMRRGYQDCGAWTLMDNTPLERRRAAWLYAQFCVCRTVSLKKTLVGLAPIRETDLASDAMSRVAPSLGGLVEFYRSRARADWTSTAASVPDYPVLAQLWSQAVAAALAGRFSPHETMDRLASAMDESLARLSATQSMARCAPSLHEPADPSTWLGRSGAPREGPVAEREPGITMPFSAVLDDWRA